jgi:hypothetical protein
MIANPQRAQRFRLTLSTASADRDPLAPVKDPLAFDNGIMHLGLKHLEEARLADLLPCFRAFNERSGGVAQLTRRRRHGFEVGLA